MASGKQHLLVVDDESAVRESMAGLLKAAGYDVSTAENGFDALLQLKRALPDVIISDLNMPQMSGFEFLSVVRRRFPEIPVIAVSGAYESGDLVPGGVIADAFYAKGSNTRQNSCTRSPNCFEPRRRGRSIIIASRLRSGYRGTERTRTECLTSC